MSKILIVLIALILATSILTGCVQTDADKKDAVGTTTAATTTTADPNGGNKEPTDTVFENKTVFRSEHFEIDGKMTKYLYGYILNVYYQYYGQYAPYYVTAEVVKAQCVDLLVYAEAAKAEGYELSADQLVEISDNVTEMEKSLKESGFDTFADYYGEGVDDAAIVEAMKLQYISNGFYSEQSDKLYDSLAEDKAGLEKYYDEHKELLFGTCFSATVTKDDFYSRLAAAATKDEIVAIMDEYCTLEATPADDVMGERAVNYPVLKDGETLSAFETWFFDGNREVGDFFADPESKTVYIVSVPAKKRTEMLKNAGHILIIPDGTTEAYKNAAKMKAEAILEEYLAGERTKDAFEKLGNANTKDGNVFYNNIYIGQMVTPFNDWVYDESRQAGDTGIVETEYGYHIMYFVGDGDFKNYEYFALSELYEKALDDWAAEIAARYEVSTDSAELNKIIH